LLCGDGSRKPHLRSVTHCSDHGVFSADEVLLGNKPDLVLDAVVLFNGIDAVLQDRRVRLLVTDQGVDQRRFASAGSAEQKDKGIRGNVQGDIF